MGSRALTSLRSASAPASSPSARPSRRRSRWSGNARATRMLSWTMTMTRCPRSGGITSKRPCASPAAPSATTTSASMRCLPRRCSRAAALATSGSQLGSRAGTEGPIVQVAPGMATMAGAASSKRRGTMISTTDGWDHWPHPLCQSISSAPCARQPRPLHRGILYRSLGSASCTRKLCLPNQTGLPPASKSSAFATRKPRPLLQRAPPLQPESPAPCSRELSLQLESPAPCSRELSLQPKSPAPRSRELHLSNWKAVPPLAPGSSSQAGSPAPVPAVIPRMPSCSWLCSFV